MRLLRFSLGGSFAKTPDLESLRQSSLHSIAINFGLATKQTQVSGDGSELNIQFILFNLNDILSK